MCCFSQRVELVSDTNIFARSSNGSQLLVYSMTYAAAGDLAMVLPLPVPPRPPEDAVRFINLERYPDFFAHLRRGFPLPMAASSFKGMVRSAAPMAPMLKVHDVGSFEASFVPRIDDFDRLDERFRIPANVWDQLPAYRDFGFAVFKLKGSAAPPARGFLDKILGRRTAAGKPRTVHPMAFAFPRRNPDLLYFPTVHIHDRKVHAQARFDHMLYCQAGSGPVEHLEAWERSGSAAKMFMDIPRTEGIVEPNQYCFRLALQGRLKNMDTLVGKGGVFPEVVKTF